LSGPILLTGLKLSIENPENARKGVINLMGMFLLGALTGGILGVVFMCLFQINRKDGDT
jgi:hypothetical protein